MPARLPLRQLQLQRQLLRLSSYPSLRTPIRAPQQHRAPAASRTYASVQSRHFSVFPSHRLDQSLIDAKMDEITELYATAKDEFEIAAEETEKQTVYAESDRAAAREELTKLQEAYRDVVEGSDKELAEEVKRRVGNRIRELESAVSAMEEAAMGQD